MKIKGIITVIFIMLSFIFCNILYASPCAYCKAEKNGDGELCPKCHDKLYPNGSITSINPEREYFSDLTLLCIENQDTQQIKLILDKGFDIHKIDNDGRTLLHHSINRGRGEMSKFLLGCGSNPNIISRAGNPILISAMLRPDADAGVIMALIEKGADINAGNREGRQPFETAIKRDFTDIVKLMVEKGADVNKKIAAGLTPLSVAAENNCTGLAKLLIEKSAEVNLKNDNGKTAYDMTTSQPIRQLLLDKGYRH